MSDAWLADVYMITRDAWGYDDAELAEIARTGVRASFADDNVKRDLLRDIDSWLTGTEG